MPDILVMVASRDDRRGSPGYVSLSPQDITSLSGFRNQRVIVEVMSRLSARRHQFYLADVLHFGRLSDDQQGWCVPLQKALKAV